jgi:hypothetical protein
MRSKGSYPGMPGHLPCQRLFKMVQVTWTVSRETISSPGTHELTFLLANSPPVYALIVGLLITPIVRVLERKYYGPTMLGVGFRARSRVAWPTLIWV